MTCSSRNAIVKKHEQDSANFISDMCIMPPLFVRGLALGLLNSIPLLYCSLYGRFVHAAAAPAISQRRSCRIKYQAVTTHNIIIE